MDPAPHSESQNDSDGTLVHHPDKAARRSHPFAGANTLTEHHTLLVAALDDMENGRLSEVEAGHLDPATQLPGTFRTTNTFWSAWQLAGSELSDRVAALAVMRGVAKEPRHPAYRTTPTTTPGVYQCHARNYILTVHITPKVDGMNALENPGTLTWLTIHAA